MDKVIAHVISVELAILNYNLYIIINRKSMKPLNLDNSPCTPTSSNCVIWQGPNIPCIKLCKGDTVSDVVFALATELCTIIDTLNVSNYDLSCFNSVACPPANFQALIQYLINQICDAQGITVTDKSTTSGCPDCVVTVASCFIEGNQTTMQLVDYVNMIANKVCGLILQITDLQNQITDLDIRVTVLENAPAPVFTLPSILVDCTLQAEPFIGSGGAATAINTVLSALINDDTYGYCALRTATGLPADIITAVESQCITSGTDSLVYGTPMGTAYSGTWVSTPETVADSITNLWIALCDVFTYTADNEISVTDTNTVNLTYSAGVLSAAVQDTGWVNLSGFSSFMSEGQSYAYPQVRRIGNQLHFRGQVIVPLVAGGGGALAWTFTGSSDSYYNNTTVAPYTGSGGMVLNTAGSAQFNNNGSGSALTVIPTSVLPSGYVIDGTYQTGLRVVSRTFNTGSGSSALTSLFNLFITNTGTLGFALVKDIEDSPAGTGTPGFDSAHANAIISHVTLGEQIPQYAAAATTIYGNTTAGAQALDIDFDAAREYKFSCNANDEDEVGGFVARLDGLTAFISPCGTLISTPAPCA